MESKYRYIIKLFIIFILYGCGDCDIETKNISYNVKVLDEPILSAIVTAKECSGETINKGNGSYLLTGCSSKPTIIRVKEGYFKLEDEDETLHNYDMGIEFILNTQQTQKEDNFIITPLTTLASTIKSEDELKELSKQILEDENYNRLFEDLSTDREIKNFYHKINLILFQGTKLHLEENSTDEFIATIYEAIKDTNVTKSNIKDNMDKIYSSIKQNYKYEEINETISNEIGEKIGENYEDFIRYYGFVYDEIISEVNVTLSYNDINYTTVKSDRNGYWEMKVAKNITRDNDILLFQASYKDNNSTNILLKSAILTKDLKNENIVNQNDDNGLTISNVTSAKLMLLEKQDENILKNAENFEKNLTSLEEKHPDEILKTSAIIKAIVDKKVNIINGTNSSYDIVKSLISIKENNGDTNITIDTNKTINENKTIDINETIITTIEKEITNDEILSIQLETIKEENKTKDGVFQLPLNYYEFEVSFENNDYLYNIKNFDNTLVSNQNFKLIKGEFKEQIDTNLDGYFWNDSNWQDFKFSNNNYTLSEDDKKILYSNSAEKSTITIEEEKILNGKTLIQKIGKYINLPENSKKIVLKEKFNKNSYVLSYKLDESYKNFSDFINKNCGKNIFLHSNKFDGGLSFGGVLNEKLIYECNGNDINGTLYEVSSYYIKDSNTSKDLNTSTTNLIKSQKISDKEAGTWKITTIPNSQEKILLIDPKIKSNYDNYSNIFAFIKGSLMRGYIRKTNDYIIKNKYNDIAAEAIKEFIIKEANNEKINY